MPGGVEARGDIGIRDGRIAAIAADLSDAPAGDRIDADGRVVLPGAVDSHFHLGIYRDLLADTESETTSCPVGGVTSVISYFRTGHHYLDRSGPYREIFPEVLDTVAGHARVDYGFHLAPMTPEHVREIPWLVEEMGVSSFKYFMFYKGFNLAGSSRDAGAYTMTEDYDLGHLFEIMETAAAVGARTARRISVSVHCEQPELLRVFIERAKADPSVTGLAEYSAGRPPLTERLSVEEAAVLADVTGAPVNFLHLSSRTALDAATAVSRRYPGSDIVAETTLHHLALCYEDLDAVSVRGKVNPPIRSRDDNDALWNAVRDGRITTVASDHACCLEELKGESLWPAQPGFGGTALLYPILLSEGYHKRGLSLSRIAEIAAAAPARAYNLWGRKGGIMLGADADLAIVDLDLEQVVTAELCRSAQDHCPFQGMTVKGWPATTVLRGSVVFDKGEVAGDYPGVYLHR
jgi:dihydropyrimidinase/allantoinase